MRYALVLMVFCVLLAGCAGNVSTVVIPTPTVEPQSTSTPAPTSTPEPTLTPVPQTCSVLSESFLAETKTLLAEWDDAKKVAQSSTRVTMGPQVSMLQEIRRRFMGLNAPTCAKQYQDAMARSMNKTMDSYLAFMQNLSESAVRVHREMAAEALDEANQALAEMAR